VADEGCLLEIVLLEEGFDIVGDGSIVVDFVVRGVAVVPRVNGVDWAIESACECTTTSLDSTLQYTIALRTC
jgi:hypothetical protein